MRPDERGQSLALLIALLGLGALVVVALGDADLRLLGGLRALRAAEAAAEAAGSVVADRLAELDGRDRDEQTHSGEGGGDPIAIALADRELPSRAEAAAREVLAALGAELVRVTLARRADELSVRAQVSLEGRQGTARVGVRPR